MTKRIAIALSGGVDSAVAALLLKKSGVEVFALFMKNWEDDDTESGCHDKEDLFAAAAVADTLGLELEVVNFAAEYKAQVFTPFLSALRGGLTPNPDVLCNAAIKFGVFAERARQLGATAIATGHYARTRQIDGAWQLLKGEDSAKDQSYFLHRLSAAQLASAVFPLGSWHKADTRAAAHDAGLHNWARKDSTGICFVGKRHFADFVGRYLSAQPGAMETPEGKVVGEHCGLAFYTIGQRQGLGIGGAKGPWFVAAKRPADNVLIVVSGESHPLLYASRTQIIDAHWIAEKPPPTKWVYAARLRHRQPPASCFLSRADEQTAEIVFAEPQRSPAPGQYAVIYDGNICLGGGVIESAT